ncbi:Hypothetical predicted protein [Mytilus galloprovincialis]|uniref:Uncharacterized protein n=1 Tax=Mytilus galloprovincialis TaxID=29158 RepID=A0A8B6F864_MYTGA|nr:Hypothetical predicted protein [Mytilus galloprovincialis]
MTITWTNDIIGGTTKKMARNDELDSQSIHIEDNLDSKTRSVGELSNGCNSICNASPYEITHSREGTGTDEGKHGAEIKIKLFHLSTKLIHTCIDSMWPFSMW